MRSRPLPRTTRVWTRDSASLDHRPRRISVGEITTEQKEDITEHFKVSTMIFLWLLFKAEVNLCCSGVQLCLGQEGPISQTCPKDGL